MICCPSKKILAEGTVLDQATGTAHQPSRGSETLQHHPLLYRAANAGSGRQRHRIPGLGHDGNLRHPKVELPAVFFVHQLRGVVYVIQSQDVRQFVHDDGADEWGTARPGQCVCEVRCVKSHLAGDVNIGFARNLDRPMGNRMITRSVLSGHDGR